MNPTQEVIKAWWFDRLSDLAAQNMALAAELAALREGQGAHVDPVQKPGNGMAGGPSRPRQEAPNG
jgi:hypothetical protein